MSTHTALRVCSWILASVVSAASARAAPDVTLWVVQPPGQLVAFDTADFSRIGGVRLPPAAFDDPSKLCVNGRGQFLVRIDDTHLWLWDGRTARTLPATPAGEADSAAFSGPGLTPKRQWLLGDDGSSLFVLESAGFVDESGGADTAGVPLRLRVTDFAQRPRGTVFERAAQPCRGALLPLDPVEPCPTASMWAPGGAVRGCIVLTQWDQGSDGRRGDLPTVAYRFTRCSRTAAGWTLSDVPRDWGCETLLDASGDGMRWVQALHDDGCCGWSNGSSDQTRFGDADTTVIVFDEWSEFGNENYDISFFTADARIAPGGRRVALSVHATEGPGADIPL